MCRSVEDERRDDRKPKWERSGKGLQETRTVGRMVEDKPEVDRFRFARFQGNIKLFK